MKLDYYVYSKFCENPGNQCYVLGQAGCHHCLRNSSGNPYMVPEARCGMQGVQDMVWRYKGAVAAELYDQLTHKISDVNHQVFDLLGALDPPPKASGKGITQPKPPDTLG